MKPPTINRNANALLDNRKIAARLSDLRTNAANRAEVTVADVIREAARLGFSDIRRLFGEDGDCFPWPSGPRTSPSPWPRSRLSPSTTFSKRIDPSLRTMGSWVQILPGAPLLNSNSSLAQIVVGR